MPVPGIPRLTISLKHYSPPNRIMLCKIVNPREQDPRKESSGLIGQMGLYFHREIR